MDAQSPFASRDDIWRIFDELKELHREQLEQGVRIARLERRREDDAKLKSVWNGPLSPYPIPIGGPIPSGTVLSSYHPHRWTELTIFLEQNLSSTPLPSNSRASTKKLPTP